MTGQRQVLIPAELVTLLRGALYAQLERTIERAPSGPDVWKRAAWQPMFDRLNRTCAALNAIEWDTPAWQGDVNADMNLAIVAALRADLDSWNWLAEQEHAETAEGRERAAANAATIRRFLADVMRTAVMGR
jgi:hypothetical protein